MFKLSRKKSKATTDAANEADYKSATHADDSILCALEHIDRLNKALESPKPNDLENMFVISIEIPDKTNLTMYFYKDNFDPVYAEVSDGS